MLIGLSLRASLFLFSVAAALSPDRSPVSDLLLLITEQQQANGRGSGGGGSSNDSGKVIIIALRVGQ